MEIPILLGANPRTANSSAWVPVRFDKWAIVMCDVVDSEFILHSDSSSIFPFNLLSLNGKVFDGPCQVRVEFVRRGTEKAISVFVKEHHD